MRKVDDLADERQSGEASDWSERSRAPIADDKALQMISRRSLIVYATAAILIGPGPSSRASKGAAMISANTAVRRR